MRERAKKKKLKSSAASPSWKKTREFPYFYASKMAKPKIASEKKGYGTTLYWLAVTETDYSWIHSFVIPIQLFC